jgi:ATP-dependent exoDNAse (exonuclease V) alpha subunit
VRGASGRHGRRRSAALETRRAKQHGAPVDRLRDEWRARAAEHRLDGWTLQDLVDRPGWREAEPEEGVARRLEGPDGLTHERSTFCRRDVVQAFAEAARDGARVAAIEAAADAFLARYEVVVLDEVAGERRYTTRELLQVERDLLDGAERRRGEGAGRASEDDVDAALAARHSAASSASSSRRSPAATMRCWSSGRRRAPARRSRWMRRGRRGSARAWLVLGCALSARAACELREQAAIDATTIARLTHRLDRGAALSRGGVLVVDEAGMVGTRDLARVAEAAEHAEAKLVLIGGRSSAA